MKTVLELLHRLQGRMAAACVKRGEKCEDDIDLSFVRDAIDILEAPLKQADGKGERRVVAAACRMKDGTMLVSARHWDGAMIALASKFNLERSHGPENAGFVDQRNVYMTRAEAWKVAEAAGQILYRCGGDTIDGGYLFSENLY